MIYYYVTISYDTGVVITIPGLKKFSYTKSDNDTEISWAAPAGGILEAGLSRIVSVTYRARLRPFYWLWCKLIGVIE